MPIFLATTPSIQGALIAHGIKAGVLAIQTGPKKAMSCVMNALNQSINTMAFFASVNP